MRMLVIDDAARQKVVRVLEYAKQHEHWYRPFSGEDHIVPGDNANLQVHLDTYRCVFSYTKIPDGGLYRHLSISVPSIHYPNVFVGLTIAQMFGFTGWDGQNEELPKGWLLDIDKKNHCVVMAQLVSERHLA